MRLSIVLALFAFQTQQALAAPRTVFLCRAVQSPGTVVEIQRMAGDTALLVVKHEGERDLVFNVWRNTRTVTTGAGTTLVGEEFLTPSGAGLIVTPVPGVEAEYAGGTLHPSQIGLPGASQLTCSIPSEG